MTLIYIDPPYNTGSDGFIYKDKRILDKFPDGTDVPKDHPLRHSYWLSFMSKRLELARDLLKEGGSIFLSIGDDELANLKLLCDKIFGDKNCIAVISRIAKTASNKGKFFATSCDYVLLYSKQAEYLDDNSFKQEVNSELYNKEDENGKYRDDIALYQSSLDPMRGCVNQRYYIQDPEGGLLIPPGNIFPDTKEDACFVPPSTKTDKVFRWSYSTYLQKKHLLVFKVTKTSPLLNENGNQAKYNIYTKSYLHERQKTGVKPRNFLIEKEFLNRKGADYIKKMGISFSYSKPKSLIQHLLTISNTDKEAIILDFFAGSGTTAEVVLDMNITDSGSRQFIICTNNEDNICQDVTYPRLNSVINGYSEVKSKKKIPALGNSLKYYKTSFVGNNNILSANDKDKTELAKKAGCLLSIAENTLDEAECSDHFQFFKSNDRNTAIYFQEDLSVLDAFVNKVEKLENPTTVYLFSWGNKSEFESMFDHIPNINIKTIPQPILEIYKKIYYINN